MFKRELSLILALLLILSMTGCGSSAPEEAPAAAPTIQTEAPATTEAPTEPTLSAEEILINSLPEKVRQAYDLGLVDLELLEDLDRICLGAEAAKIIQNIHVAHHGVESKIMNQLLEHEHANLEVTRYWLAQAMFAAEAEFIEEAPHEDYLENLEYMLTAIEKDMGYNDLYAYFTNSDGYVIHFNNDRGWFGYKRYEPGAIVSAPSAGFIPDIEEMFLTPKLADQQVQYVNCGEEGKFAFVDWVVKAYDRLTGEKIMAADERIPFQPRQTMTVQEVVETTLRYYNWIPPEQEMLAYDEIPAYDAAIITDELLNKETTLPEASCQNLPAEWHGIASKALSHDDTNALADHMLQENEIQAIADAGFNFLNLHLDFRYFASDRYTIYEWKYEQAEGCMNETRLKELDQIIAWCMERDIHVNLVCDEKVAGWAETAIPPVIFKKESNAQPLAQQWQILARRYAAIPNTYLSFTMYDEPEIYQGDDYAAFFAPVVEAIRAVSPDRCIIANMAYKYPGEEMAAMGVALSTQAVWPKNFHFDPEANAHSRGILFEEAVWPYEANGQIFDAESAMTNRAGDLIAPDAVAAAAQEHGVGFMIFGWAPTCKKTPVLQERFSDEFMQNYLTDFAQVLADRGYGWCYGDTNGFVGLFTSYPAINSTTYTQVDNAPLYIDDEMFGWFQTLNGVN